MVYMSQYVWLSECEFCANKKEHWFCLIINAGWKVLYEEERLLSYEA